MDRVKQGSGPKATETSHEAGVSRITPCPAGLELWIDNANSLLRYTEGDIQKLLRHEEVMEPAIQRFLVAGYLPPQQHKRLKIRDLVAARELLRQIAGLGANQGTATIVTPVTEGAWLICENGVLTIEVAPLLKMLEGIEAWRIGICPICQKFYWLGRKDKSACSVRCAGTLRMRRLRENREYKSKRLKAKGRQ